MQISSPKWQTSATELRTFELSLQFVLNRAALQSHDPAHCTKVALGTILADSDLADINSAFARSAPFLREFHAVVAEQMAKGLGNLQPTFAESGYTGPRNP